MITPRLCGLLFSLALLLSASFRIAGANLERAEEHGRGYPEIPNDPRHYMDHEVVLDGQGRLLPWTSYDHVLEWSMKFVTDGPTCRTRHGLDPQYLVSACMHPDGTLKPNQNNVGSSAYFGVETLLRYYPYSGNARAIASIRALLDRLILYHTPKDWAWPRVPRAQDDTPDGEYTDEWTGVAQACAIGVAYIRFYKFTGEKRYLRAGREVARTMARHVRAGDATHSPLPFRVNLQTGRILSEYSAAMVFPAMLFDELNSVEPDGNYRHLRDALWQWVLEYPVANNQWYGYFEDVDNARVNSQNLDQLIPLETARFMLKAPSLDPDYRRHVPALLDWVESRFGKTRRYGAASIREQDVYPLEMISHTARYASVRALWHEVSHDPKDREEARAACALSTYGVKNNRSPEGMALNWVGPVYHARHWANWYSDGYFDYLTHVLDCLGAIPEMALESDREPRDHLLKSTSIVRKIAYRKRHIEYETREPDGVEILKLNFQPRVLSGRGPLPRSHWSFKASPGAPGILQIRRTGQRHIVIEENGSLDSKSILQPEEPLRR